MITFESMWLRNIMCCVSTLEGKLTAPELANCNVPPPNIKKPATVEAAKGTFQGLDDQIKLYFQRQEKPLAHWRSW